MITFREFTKTFGARAAVSSLTLKIEEGEVMALLGPNGSGKTTSIKAAAGVLQPTSGTVLIGEPPRPASDPEARRIAAFLPQRVSFPEHLTGAEILEFYCALRGQSTDRVDAVLASVSLGDATRRHAGTYSGGMTQRLGLAVALASDAPLLLLDEPTAALDPEGLAAFYALVGHRRGQGQTTVFSSHQLDDVERLADRVAVLVDGALVTVLTAAELADRVADRGEMRVIVHGLTAAALADVRTVATDVHANDDVLLVRGASTLRPRVLEALARHHVDVRSLTVQEGRLDQWYRELVAAQPSAAAVATGASQVEDPSTLGRALYCAKALWGRR